jgi:hypothetical protein
MEHSFPAGTVESDMYRVMKMMFSTNYAEAVRLLEAMWMAQKNKERFFAHLNQIRRMCRYVCNRQRQRQRSLPYDASAMSVEQMRVCLAAEARYAVLWFRQAVPCAHDEASCRAFFWNVVLPRTLETPACDAYEDQEGADARQAMILTIERHVTSKHEPVAIETMLTSAAVSKRPFAPAREVDHMRYGSLVHHWVFMLRGVKTVA